MTTKIALVGIGAIARSHHVPSLAASPDWELAATVSRRGRIDGIEGYAGMEEMLAARPDIPVISLCVPPEPRFAYAVAALEAGRHVMLEKPPGATLSECHTLEALAREKGVSLFATWHSRQSDKIAPARDWLADKTIRRLTVTWREDVRRWHPGQDWIWEPGGLGVFDPGINALSIVTAILPDPIHLNAARLEFPANKQTPIAAALDFHHPAGAEVTAEFDWREEGDQIWQIEIETDGGRLALTHGGARMLIDGAEVGTHDDKPLSDEYPRLYAAMADLVARRAIDMDLAPLRHVADACMLGERVTVDPFEW